MARMIYSAEMDALVSERLGLAVDTAAYRECAQNLIRRDGYSLELAEDEAAEEYGWELGMTGVFPIRRSGHVWIPADPEQDYVDANGQRWRINRVGDTWVSE